MADSILLRFATQNLDRAKATAKEIAAAIKSASAGLKDLAPEARKAFRAAVRASAKDRAAEIEAQGERLGLERSAAGIRQRALDGIGTPAGDAVVGRTVSKYLRVANRVGSFAGGIASVITSEDPTGTKGLQLTLHGVHDIAQALGPAGAIVGAIAGIVSQVLSVVEKQEERRLAAQEALVRAQVSQALKEADVSRRYQDDAQYAAKLEAEARGIYLGQVNSGWEPRAARLLRDD